MENITNQGNTQPNTEESVKALKAGCGANRKQTTNHNAKIHYHKKRPNEVPSNIVPHLERFVPP